MRALVALALRYRWALLLLTPVLLALGVLVGLRAPLDVFPEFVTPQIVVQTEAEGLTPEQVEALVTRPIEQALNATPGLTALRSNSIAGLSVVTLVLADGFDVLAARQAVGEKLAPLIGELPQGAKPSMEPLTSSTMDLLKIGLVSDRLDPMALRDFADWQLRPRLLAVPGVARITVFGGERRQLQVQVDPQRLHAFALDFDEVAAAAAAATGVVGAGAVDTGAQQLPLSLGSEQTPPAALANALVRRVHGVSLRLGDVAEVRYGAAAKFGDALIQGRPGVLLTMSGQYGANTLATTERIEKVLAELAPTLAAAGIELYPALHRPASFVERALGNLRDALLLGTALILVVLYAFLRDWRSAVIAFLAIPLSLLAAVWVLALQGISLDTMSLGGFAVALGVLVDDAIIGLENILRRLRENRDRPHPHPRLQVVLEASVEIRASVFYATLVVLAVFLPVWMLGGIQGAFLRPMAEAFALSVLASLAVAAVFTPAFAALGLNAHALHAEPAWIGRLRAGQERAVGACARHPARVFAGLWLLAGIAVLGLLRAEGEFLPMFREGHFVLQIAGLAGTSVEESRRLGARISAEVLALPEVATVEQQVGRAEAGEDTWGPERSEFHVELKDDPDIDQVAVQERLRAILAGYPGLRTEVTTFLGDRISETVSGETAQGVVTIYGEDLDRLQQDADAIAHVLSALPGLRDVRAQRSGGAPMLAISLDSSSLARAGLSLAQVQRTLAAAFSGARVAQVFVDSRMIDVVLTLPPALRRDPAAVGRLLLHSASEGDLPLAQLARIEDVDGRVEIDHEGGHRRAVVTYNLAGVGAGTALARVRHAITQQVRLGAGNHVEYSGVAESERATRWSLAVNGGLALVLATLLLNAAFAYRRHAWLVLANLPFALLGGALAIAISGVGLTLGALVGLVTVFGISARNAILLLAHAEHLVDVEGVDADAGLYRRAASERMVPVLMTAAVTALGLLPLAFGLGRAGHEIEAPLAITVLGGLLSSTVLTLLVLPGWAARSMRATFAVEATA